MRRPNPKKTMQPKPRNETQNPKPKTQNPKPKTTTRHDTTRHDTTTRKTPEKIQKKISRDFLI